MTMNDTCERPIRASRRWGKALAAFLLAFGLACAPLSAAALDGADAPEVEEAAGAADDSAASEGTATMGDLALAPDADALGTMPQEPSAADGPAAGDAPEASNGAEEATYSMTFYYCEVVYYDDPNFDHPSNMRVLGTRTVEGLHEGDVLNTWDYVVPIEGFAFFDAWPAKPVVTTDNDANGVELHYMRSNREECTVNYYALTDGHEPAQDVADIGGVSIGFEKMGSFQMENQLFDREVVGDRLALPLPGLMYVDSYPESIHLSTNADENVINLFYAASMTTLPDAVPVPDDAAPPMAGGTGSSEGGNAATATPATPVTQASLEAEPTAAEARLAQTGDGAATILAMLLLVTGLVALGTAVVAWRHGRHDLPHAARTKRL